MRERVDTRILLLAALWMAASFAGCATHTDAPPVATNTVVIPGAWVFEPATATVKAGSVVTFEDRGGAAHTVTFDDGTFDQTIAAGASVERTFPTPGTFTYHCKFHPPGMKGTIVVE